MAALGVCYADGIGLYADGFRPSATCLIPVVDGIIPPRAPLALSREALIRLKRIYNF
jgi:hypothetical protein